MWSHLRDSDSEQAMNFQITLLLTSFVYLDVITQQIPAVQNFYDAPMILLFFVIILVLQVVLIVGKLFHISYLLIFFGINYKAKFS